MHNSQNSTSSKTSFASVVLAQGMLLDIKAPCRDSSNLDIQTISNSIISIIEQKTNSKISEVPIFHKTKKEEGGLEEASYRKCQRI